MTTLDSTASQDIDALLAEADSLMNEMAVSLGASSTDDSDASSAKGATEADAARTDADAAEAAAPDSSGASDVSADAVRELMEGVTGFSEQVDPEAQLEAERSADELVDDEVEAVLSRLSTGGSVLGPRSAPEEWVAEAEAGKDGQAGEQLPHIPETLTDSGDTTAGRIGRILGRVAESGPVSVAKIPLRVLVHVLVVLDRPFAGLGHGVKTVLGYVAIGTLLVAMGTWLVGSLQLVN